MTSTGFIGRSKQAIAFARHIEPSKLARRAQLTLQRKWADAFPALTAAMNRSALTPAARSNPPGPVFPPRAVDFVTAGKSATATFLRASQSLQLDAIDWHTTGPGRSHQLWSMNLHYMEYLEAVPDAIFVTLVESWIASNRQGRPGAWRTSWNSYALSLRVVVWMQQLARRKAALPQPFVARAEASIADQLRFLMRNLETDLGGNHIVKNIKALVWAAAYYTGPEPQRWQARALSLLRRELAHQILADGMHDERSPAYHAQVFADLLECRHVLARDPFGGFLDKALAGMARAAADLVHPDGQIAQFNDAGLTMSYSPAMCLDAYERLGFPRPQTQPVFAYEAAGYFGQHSPRFTLIADCGRIGPDSLPAHAHGDILSFELSAGCQRVIVDQGVFEYIAGDRRQRARAAASHNTLAIDGADQAGFFGAFRCGRRPNVKVHAFTPTADGFSLEGSHDGYSHLPGSPRHVRRFEAGPQTVRLTDQLEGTTTAPAWIGFLLHPAVNVELDGRRAILTVGQERVILTASQPLTVEDAVWWPDMGDERPTLRLRIPVPRGAREVVTLIEDATPAAKPAPHGGR